MRTLRTEITIDAPAQTVWSILDDIARYPEWNRVIPYLEGKTTVRETLQAKISFSDSNSFPFSPILTRIVGARELRWVSEVAGEEVTRAEHYFILTPLADGGTHLEHNESFEGPLADTLWPMVNSVARHDYEQMNRDLKFRAEAATHQQVMLHPLVDGQNLASTAESNRLLRCKCENSTVEVQVSVPLMHNHLCGCSQCWRPPGALFAITAVIAADGVAIISNSQKLKIANEATAIRRHICKECGVHMFGSVDDRSHHFFGLAFIHPELAAAPVPAPEFAGFVSSVIEGGCNPATMAAIRSYLAYLGIAAYDAFSPEIMDIIAWHKVKMRGVAGAPRSY